MNKEEAARLFIYKGLAAGQSKAEALRFAKLQLIQDPATSDPRYWAPFILIGEADSPVLLRSSWGSQAGTKFLFGIALLLLALAAILLVKRAAETFRL
jgi:hypothetical protein